MTAETSQTLDRGLRVLKLLADTDHGLTVTELSHKLGVNRTVVYRLLATLEQHALVRRDLGGRARVGLGVLRLGRQVHPLVREAAMPALRSLAEDIGATAHLTLVDGSEALAVAVPDLPGIQALSAGAGLTGLTAFALVPPGSGDARVHVRSFAPGDGVPEDPVCGSGNASVGAYLGATGLLSQTGRSYVAAQGMQMQRDGRVAVSVYGPDHVEIGGPSVTVLDGTIRLD